MSLSRKYKGSELIKATAVKKQGPRLHTLIVPQGLDYETKQLHRQRNSEKINNPTANTQNESHRAKEEFENESE